MNRVTLHIEQHNTNLFLCDVMIGDEIHATARGRDEGAAVADAIALFRTRRSLRKA